MPFKYSCFISYCHGQHDLTKSFIEQLKKAMKAYLEPFLDEEVFIDEERLQPGYEYNEALSNAICQSIGMIVVYTPTYEKHPYCLREYAAMECIEEKRLKLLGERADPGLRFIIPIIFRGDLEDLPSKIKKCKYYCDFSKFTLSNIDISSNPEFIKQIEKIAKCIYKHYKVFDESDFDASSDCGSFILPPEKDIQPWREKPKKPVAPFHEVKP